MPGGPPDAPASGLAADLAADPDAARWARHLAPGERLVWHGAPVRPERGPLRARLRAGLSRLDQDKLHDALLSDASATLGLFMVFAMVAVTLTLGAGALLPLIAFAMLVAVPLTLLARPVLRRWRLARTVYALTDRRALVLWQPLRGLPRLRAVDLRPGLRPRSDGGSPGSIDLSADAPPGGRLAPPARFEDLADPLAVLALIGAAAVAAREGTAPQ